MSADGDIVRRWMQRCYGNQPIEENYDAAVAALARLEAAAQMAESNQSLMEAYVSGTVLDPFFGSGTTGLVARRL